MKTKTKTNAKAKLSVGVLFVVALTSAIAGVGTDGVSTALRANDLVVVQAGEVVYQAQCASCHGQYLEGEADWRTRDANGYLPAPPHDASGHTWHHADDLLFEITKYGPAVVIKDPEYKSLMPAFETILTDEEIVAVLSFIKNTWPEEQRLWQDEVNGTKKDGFSTSGKNKSSILDKLKK